jgi:hypothetical protein
VSKQIFLRRLAQLVYHPAIFKKGANSCVADLEHVLLKYNLFDFLTDFMREGSFPAKGIWKTLTTNAIVDNELAAYNERVLVDSDFTRYRAVKPDCFATSISWQVAKEIPSSLKYFRLVITLLTSGGSTEGYILCEYCGVLFSDYLLHYIMTCPKCMVQRDKFWDFITNNFPPQVSAGLFNMDDGDLVNILLGGPCNVTLNVDVLSDFNMYCIFHYRCALFLFSLKDTILPLLRTHSG